MGRKGGVGRRMRGRGEGEREGRRGRHAVLMLDFLLMRSHWGKGDS